jgi:hypothetical protein
MCPRAASAASSPPLISASSSPADMGKKVADQPNVSSTGSALSS